MHSEYVKEYNILDDKSEEEQNEELIEHIKGSKMALQNMHNNIRFAENDLVDYYAYSIKAEEARYNYLIKLAKQRNIEI